MPQVYLSLGSNINRYQHIAAALDALSAEFGELQISPIYESESVGFAGSRFLNLVVGLQTEKPVGELSALLREIEHDNGRRRDGPKFSPRTLDIDILTYGQYCGEVAGLTLPRDEIERYAFVLLPLAELAPAGRHPQTGQAYRAMWQAFSDTSQELWRVPFRWKGKEF